MPLVPRKMDAPISDNAWTKPPVLLSLLLAVACVVLHTLLLRFIDSGESQLTCAQAPRSRSPFAAAAQDAASAAAAHDAASAAIQDVAFEAVGRSDRDALEDAATASSPAAP